MAATVLNTDLAIKTSVYIVNAFVELRERSSAHKDLAQKLNELETIIGIHDERIHSLFNAIKTLTASSRKPRRLIGFKSSR